MPAEIPLDPDRVKRAQARAELALKAALYHDRQAAKERAKAASLARTWGFAPPESKDS